MRALLAIFAYFCLVSECALIRAPVLAAPGCDTNSSNAHPSKVWQQGGDIIMRFIVREVCILSSKSSTLVKRRQTHVPLEIMKLAKICEKLRPLNNIMRVIIFFAWCCLVRDIIIFAFFFLERAYFSSQTLARKDMRDVKKSGEKHRVRDIIYR